MEEILHEIATQNNLILHTSKVLLGGDINEVYRLHTNKGGFVLKCNHADKFPSMFVVESRGLQLLQSTNSFKIPQVIANGKINNTAYLLMEYLPSGAKPSTFWYDFGKRLSILHRNTNSKFGLDYDNYIGSLPQYNSFQETASEFYILQRLEPQFKKAVDKGYHFSRLSSFYTRVSKEIPEEPSALLHGDLWNGNYLVSNDGQPVLIDPAIAYAPREMDIAMMHLFGGFPIEVFNSYYENFPLEYDWESRVDIWQLYYLLVHLNLFGDGYLSQVERIIKRFN